MKKKEEMLRNFIPGQRRPWAWDSIKLPFSDKEIVISLDPAVHDELIKSFYRIRGAGEDRVLNTDYVFSDGLLERVRQFDMNNRGSYSFSDWHAEQLQWQIELSGINIKRYANVGSGTTADQVISAFYLLPEETEIHIFELPTKINDAKRFLEEIGLAETFDRKIFFHPGNAAKTLPEVAAQSGGFDFIESQFLIQHLRGDDFGDFCRAMPASLNRGGLAKVNEMMLGQLGFTSGENDPLTKKMKKTVQDYFQGDGTGNSLSFLNLGWGPNGGHAWNDRDEFIGDILKFAKDLVIQPGLEINLTSQKIDYKSDILIGMRYVVVTLASVLTYQAQVWQATNPEMSKRFKDMAEWAWDKGEEVDLIVTSEHFKKGNLAVNFPEVIGVVFRKE
ncbi:MAG: hypothetical protein WC458_01320 [Patescibacteria group bacterium]